MDNLSLPIEELQSELNKAIKELAETDDLEARVKLSIVIKNLSKSMGTFFDFASDMMMHDMDYGMDFEDDFDDD